MSQFYFAKAKIRYKEDGWVVLEAPNSIVNYYKKVVEKFIWKKVSTPLYGAHVTVVAGKHEGLLLKHPNWCLYNNKLVEFRYSSTIYTDQRGEYFWLKVQCPEIPLIRESLGLKPNLKWPLHLTICFREK